MRSSTIGLRFFAVLAVVAVLGSALWLIWRPDGGATASLEPIVEDAQATRPAETRVAETQEAGAESRESLAPDTPPDETPAPHTAPAMPTRVSGRVLDDRTGAAVPAATVLLRRGREQRVLCQAVTGDDGRFEVRAVDAPASAVVRKAGLVPAFLTVPAPDQAATADLGDIRLRHGWRARALLLRAGNQAPIADAPLWHVTRREPPLALGRTDDRGALLLADALPPTGVQDDPMLLALTDDGIGHLPLILPEGADTCDLQVTLQPGGDLAITVQDEQGVPIEGVALALEPEALPWSAVWLPPELLERLRARSDSQGRARIRHVPHVAAGAVSVTGSAGFELRAGGPGLRATSTRGFQVIDGAETRVLVRMARLQEIALVVSVTDPQGKPVPWLSVRATGTMTRIDETTVRLQSPVAADGTIRVAASAPDFADLVQQVAVPPGVREHRADLVLHPLQSVRGQLVDEAGAPVVSMSLQFLIHGGPRGWTAARSDARGNFHFAVGSEQDWLLVLGATPGRDVWIQPEPITGRGGREDLRLVLRPRPATGARLVATITAGGAPVTAVPRQIEVMPVSAAPTGTPPGRREIQTQPGQLSVSGLWSGDWQLRFQLDGDGVLGRTFTVPADATQVELRIDLAAQGAIQGEVRFEGIPPDQLPELVTVTVDPVCGRQVSEGRFPVAASQGRATVRPRRGGSFRLEQVPAGSPLVLELDLGAGHPWYARTVVTVPPAGVASAVLRAEGGGFVRLRTEVPLPAGWVRFEPEDRGLFQPRAAHAQLGREPLDRTMPWPCGRHTGRVTVHGTANRGAPPLWSARVEFSVTPGATTEVRVPGPAPR